MQKAVQAKNKKNQTCQVPSNCGHGSHDRFSFGLRAIRHCIKHLDVNRIDGAYFWRIQIFMTQGIQDPDHVWLVMIKAMQALTRYGAAGIEDTGLGNSDFRVLEVLLHKGALPVNTIGPLVGLTPGSISIAVDRLVARGLVSRVESAED